jgi:hypothetical protein
MRKGRVIGEVRAFDDSTGKVREPVGVLEFVDGVARLTFTDPGDHRTTHSGSMEEFRILRVTGREFFGTWSIAPDLAVPFKGYFCGKLR